MHMKSAIRVQVWLHGRLRRADDQGISTVEALLITTAVGAVALAFVATFTDVLDGFFDDFESTFGE
jgi:hypothetical protein